MKSLFCKPNNSETDLPILGINVASLILDTDAIAKEQTEKAEKVIIYRKDGGGWGEFGQGGVGYGLDGCGVNKSNFIF